MAAFAALFVPNADFVNVIGMQWRGRTQIQETHVTVHRTIFRNSTNRVLSHTVRFPNPATALVHINWEMTAGEGRPRLGSRRRRQEHHDPSASGRRRPMADHRGP